MYNQAVLERLLTPRAGCEIFLAGRSPISMERHALPSLEAAVSALREISRKVDELIPDAGGEAQITLAKIKAESEIAASYYDGLAGKQPARKAPHIASRVGLSACGGPLVGLSPKLDRRSKRIA